MVISGFTLAVFTSRFTNALGFYYDCKNHFRQSAFFFIRRVRTFLSVWKRISLRRWRRVDPALVSVYSEWRPAAPIMCSSVSVWCFQWEEMCWMWIFISSAGFNHPLSSLKARRDTNLNHLSAFDFWMFSLSLGVSGFKSARTEETHMELMKRLWIQRGFLRAVRVSRCFSLLWSLEVWIRVTFSLLLPTRCWKDSVVLTGDLLFFFWGEREEEGEMAKRPRVREPLTFIRAGVDQWTVERKSNGCVVWIRADGLHSQSQTQVCFLGLMGYQASHSLSFSVCCGFLQ